MDMSLEVLTQHGCVPAVDMSTRSDSLWLFFDTTAQRDRARQLLHGLWVTITDRSVQLNYQHTWQDVSGPALHAAHSAAFGRIEPRVQ